MNSRNIKKMVADAKDEIKRARIGLDDAIRKLGNIQKMCPHRKVDKWTNNDGYGQFSVEKCLDCGLQKDGGLK